MSVEGVGGPGGPDAPATEPAPDLGERHPIVREAGVVHVVYVELVVAHLPAHLRKRPKAGRLLGVGVCRVGGGGVDGAGSTGVCVGIGGGCVAVIVATRALWLSQGAPIFAARQLDLLRQLWANEVLPEERVVYQGPTENQSGERANSGMYVGCKPLPTPATSNSRCVVVCGGGVRGGMGVKGVKGVWYVR